ncbi:gfo/Idh/MocA family oxidoreductase [Pseudoduganella sp. FT25W]|uniref:Gfo/Idh/MocA family oxidoreductase n=1 Tax=Duganella alba TaxID=2666081 RepID=A0A6L5QL24_9BURK|nr:Gfo/Idh/MocA family oxidoreductase [Duganella alba]MRX10429.1 gfo/Idh/MocA family oxidoreductase [Duganella alba]MRX17950.1 gfo/Idh/MocA family oxidoreductase [Duganella alba]
MTQVIRWGILGTGKIAKAFATALRDTPDAKLVAVASRAVDSATKFGQEYGAERFHGSYQALADDPDVDVIYIGTPHPMHHENALMCLNGGKAVLVEKSFTMNRRQAEDIISLARAKNLFVMEAMWTRFMPSVVEAKRIVDSGEIGKPANVTADFGFTADVGPEHRLFAPELGGGALLDLGIYPLSMSSFFMGAVTGVRAQAEMAATGVDMQTAFTLTHEGGGVSSCACSLRSRTPTELTISGTKGFVRLHDRFHNTDTITVTLVDGASRNERTLSLPKSGNGYTHEAQEVGRCLRAGLIESPVMPHAETLALMGTLDDIRAQIGLRYPADA